MNDEKEKNTREETKRDLVEFDVLVDEIIGLIKKLSLSHDPEVSRAKILHELETMKAERGKK